MRSGRSAPACEIGAVSTGTDRVRPRVELVEIGGRRRLWVDLGVTEVAALECSLVEGELPRPMPYQFVVALVAATGERVQQVHIAQLADETLRAAVVLTNGAVVDARPGDALTIAVLTGAAIVVDSTLFPGGSRLT